MFDLARGAIGHFDLRVAAAAIDQGFPPDFISTDWAIQRDGSRGPNLIETMREMLGLGMGLDQIIAAVTVTPMRFYGLTPTGPAAIRLSDTLELLGIDA
jgi:predicted amidohydrolase